MSTAPHCGDVVEIETRCRIPIWRTFGRIQWHVIPEPRITLQDAATWWIHYHDSRATGCSHLAKSMSWSCHIAGVRIPSAILKIVFRHILFFLFLIQFRLWRMAAFVSSPIHLFVCMSVCPLLSKCKKNTIFSKTKQFSATVSIDDLQEVVHGVFKELMIGSLKSKMAEIRHVGSWCQNPKRRFSQILSNLVLWCLLTTYRKSTWAFQRTHYWTPKIQDGGDRPSWILAPKCKNAIFSKN